MGTDAMSNCSSQLRIKKRFKFLLHICVFILESSSMGNLIPVYPLSKTKSYVKKRLAVVHNSSPEKKWQKE